MHEIDARWTMAYAAGLGDALPCYLDTRRPEGVVAHPLFPVCFEWPVILGLRGHAGHRSLTADEQVRKRVEQFYFSVASCFESWVKRRTSPHTQRAYREDVMAFVRFLDVAWPAACWFLSPDSRSPARR